mgnify:CR=1 FL=1|tara:strand:- start:558 stop:932 length:375 start_codon:yes stop_codon:yes gene_type:complete
MNEQLRRKMIARSTREAKNRDAHVAWRVNGHAFFYGNAGYAECIGCGVRVADWSPTGATRGRAIAEKASRALPPCTKPWNLENRLKEIAKQYFLSGQSVGEDGEVTLESVNAKLDRIIKHFRIK